ncbi:hypothetical protein BDW66DRAFT_143530 [Aspergillus desertorum]
MRYHRHYLPEDLLRRRRRRSLLFWHHQGRVSVICTCKPAVLAPIKTVLPQCFSTLAKMSYT